MAFGLVLQTLSLLDVTHKSTQDEVFTLVAIATAEFAFRSEERRVGKECSS